MNDDKFWLILCGSLAIVICVIVITLGVSCSYAKKLAFENGYEEKTVEGYAGLCWVKVK